MTAIMATIYCGFLAVTEHQTKQNNRLVIHFCRWLKRIVFEICKMCIYLESCKTVVPLLKTSGRVAKISTPGFILIGERHLAVNSLYTNNGQFSNKLC